MGENSKIEWTHHTFNPWIGCAKVHEGCRHCYAESTFDKRRHVAQWGPHGTRVVTSNDNWKKPLLWNRKAAESGERHRVFCASLADVFEDFEGPIHDHRGDRLGVERPRMECRLFPAHESYEMRLGQRWATLDDVRRRLFDLIDATPHLDWLLLTKRPKNICRMWGVRACQDCTGRGDGHCPTCGRNGPEEFRANVWLGTSISDQASADAQIPELLKCRALSPVLFLSCEPLLGPVDLGLMGTIPKDISPAYRIVGEFIRWVIVGGESGHDARPMHPGWVRSLRDECHTADVAFLFKQWGQFQPHEWSARTGAIEPPIDVDHLRRLLASHDGATPSPVEPSTAVRDLFAPGVCLFSPTGKKSAGNILDGRQHLAFPEVGL